MRSLDHNICFDRIESIPRSQDSRLSSPRRHKNFRCPLKDDLASVVDTPSLEFQQPRPSPNTLDFHFCGHRISHVHGLAKVERLRQIYRSRSPLSNDRAKHGCIQHPMYNCAAKARGACKFLIIVQRIVVLRQGSECTDIGRRESARQTPDIAHVHELRQSRARAQHATVRSKHFTSSVQVSNLREYGSTACHIHPTTRREGDRLTVCCERTVLVSRFVCQAFHDRLPYTI